jgi:hypothetical protein
MEFDQLKRREFISLLGGAAVAWPLAALAQQTIPLIGLPSCRGFEQVCRSLDAGLGRRI